MTCVQTVSYSILINGQPAQPFPAKKGLRQARRPSYLFALGMESLSRSLKQLDHQPDFNYHPRCEKLQITHLMFASDLLLFSRADPISLHLLMEKFNHFSAVSGLAANLDKSGAYIGGVPTAVKLALCQEFNMGLGSFPFRYLGVPLSPKK